MAGVPSLPLFVDDYEAAAAHLTLEEDGAYLRLLRLCWRTPGCSIPADPQWIARKMRVDDATFERVIAPIIREFFNRSRGRLFQKRLRAEFGYVSELSRARKEAGKRGGLSKAQKTKGKISGNARDLLEQNGGKTVAPTPTPTPTLFTEDKSSDAGLDPEKVMFDSGRALLGQSGISADKAGSLLGKWKRDYGAPQVITALARAQREGAIEPVAFIEGCLRAASKSDAPTRPIC